MAELDDRMTDEEFEEYIREIRYWMNYLKTKGVKDVRFTCREEEEYEER